MVAGRTETLWFRLQDDTAGLVETVVVTPINLAPAPAPALVTITGGGVMTVQETVSVQTIVGTVTITDRSCSFYWSICCSLLF